MHKPLVRDGAEVYSRDGVEVYSRGSRPPEIPPRSEAEVYIKLPFQKPRQIKARITILLNKT